MRNKCDAKKQKAAFEIIHLSKKKKKKSSNASSFTKKREKVRRSEVGKIMGIFTAGFKLMLSYKLNKLI